MNGRDLVNETLGTVEQHNRSDVGNGELLLQRHGQDLRYVHSWARWLVWDGRRWHEDDIGKPTALMKETLKALSADALEIADADERKKAVRWAIESERASRVRAALEMAQSEAGVPVLPDQLDQDPWLLNVANGTIDLRTGALRGHDRADLITRVVDVSYDPAATTAGWDVFLDRVLGSDQELATFVQRAVGYSLTGLTTEQAILILYGAGANGKSTFVNTVLELLGDYAQQAPAETFVARRDGIPNDVARLRGARMVAAAELGEGRRLNEALVKRMTGGDKIAARFMRAEWFEFEPQFTPWLATNHKPEIVGTDLGIWRRIRLVPFTVTIPEHERDPQLPERLRDELAGILAWAVRGCLDWQQHGLGAPKAVADATATYRAEQDVVGQFLEQVCTLDDAATVKSSVLHTRLDYWLRSEGHTEITPVMLARRLEERGYTKRKTKGGIFWAGIGLDGVKGEGL